MLFCSPVFLGVSCTTPSRAKLARCSTSRSTTQQHAACSPVKVLARLDASPVHARGRLHERADPRLGRMVLLCGRDLLPRRGTGHQPVHQHPPRHERHRRRRRPVLGPGFSAFQRGGHRVFKRGGSSRGGGAHRGAGWLGWPTLRLLRRWRSCSAGAAAAAAAAACCCCCCCACGGGGGGGSRRARGSRAGGARGRGNPRDPTGCGVRLAGRAWASEQ
jgi:hypothetical protein